MPPKKVKEQEEYQSTEEIDFTNVSTVPNQPTTNDDNLPKKYECTDMSTKETSQHSVTTKQTNNYKEKPPDQSQGKTPNQNSRLSKFVQRLIPTRKKGKEKTDVKPSDETSTTEISTTETKEQGGGRKRRRKSKRKSKRRTKRKTKRKTKQRRKKRRKTKRKRRRSRKR